MAVPKNLTRYDYLCMAKVAHQAQRYDDAVKFMYKLVVTFNSSGDDLTPEERHLLFSANKQVINSLRTAWQTMATPVLENKGHENKAALLILYKSKIESEISKTCTSILNLLESNLIPSASASETKVLYLKAKGDYNRYLAEFKIGKERERAVEKTMNAYKAAEKISRSYVSPTHPMRLAVALNFSVFYYDILGDAYMALSVARDAFEQAAKLSKCSEESEQIMQLLKDNYRLWISN